LSLTVIWYEKGNSKSDSNTVWFKYTGYLLGIGVGWLLSGTGYAALNRNGGIKKLRSEATCFFVAEWQGASRSEWSEGGGSRSPKYESAWRLLPQQGWRKKYYPERREGWRLFSCHLHALVDMFVNQVSEWRTPYNLFRWDMGDEDREGMVMNTSADWYAGRQVQDWDEVETWTIGLEWTGDWLGWSCDTERRGMQRRTKVGTWVLLSVRQKQPVSIYF